jgi:2-oxoglutarate dehydrogenase E2 component (dihydrolipoamide succinyltransferase)
MSRMRLRIAERLKESQNTAAFLTTFNEIDMSSLMEMRKRYKDEVLKEHDVKLGFMSAFAKAACLALKEIPAANASIEGDEIVYRDFVDLSVAVATPKGLVTPVVRGADSMSLVEFEKELVGLGKKVCSPRCSCRRYSDLAPAGPRRQALARGHGWRLVHYVRFCPHLSRAPR